MYRSLLTVICILFFYSGFSQSNEQRVYYQVGGYADIGAEFIYLHYARIGIQKYLNKNFSVQAAFKVGSRSVTRWYISSSRDGVPTNWINWHLDNPNGNPFFLLQSISNPEKFGISSNQIQDHSMFYANLTFTGGFDIALPFKTNLQILAGLGLRYTDEHRIAESGDATFEYMGSDYEIYYLVPLYQRGIDAHLNTELNIIIPFSEKLRFKGGIISDFTLGFLNVGVGNYYHVGGSLQIKI